MRTLPSLFERNEQWASRVRAESPTFFAELSVEQNPRYLWIGCADSRVPASEITDVRQGEMFVHRNVANMVVHTDFNLLSVLQYAVEVLHIEHVIVCGHYGCGGVAAALAGNRLGLIDNWLRHIRDVIDKHAELLDRAGDDTQRADLLCALNVIEQVSNVCSTTIVRDAWDRGQPLCVHSWIYRLEDGILKDLDFCVERYEDVDLAYREAVSRIAGGIHRNA